MVRAINRRLRRRWLEQARLLESVTRHIAMFSAQSKEAAEAAAQIELVSEAKPLPPPAPISPEKSELILPPGVDRPSKEDRPYEVEGHRLVASVEDLPDAESRRAANETDAEERNSPGSYEKLMGLLAKEARGSS